MGNDRRFSARHARQDTMQRERQFDDQALTARSGWGSIVFDMSMNAREAAKEGISILRNARQHGTSREPLHGNQLAFE